MYNSQPRTQSGFNRDRRENTDTPPIPFRPLNIKEYVDDAEKVVSTLRKNSFGKFDLTTSKIRNLLAMTSEVLNKVNNTRASAEGKDDVTDGIRQDLNSLKIRTIYECGREESVKDFVKKAYILEHLKEIKTLDDCEVFCHYMEALVAYHRYMGGKD